MRERSLSGSGWKECVMGMIASYLDTLQLPPGDAEHFLTKGESKWTVTRVVRLVGR
jgi:hypothetical protein